MVSSNGYIETPKYNIIKKSKKVLIGRLLLSKTAAFKKIIDHHRKSASLGGHLIFFKNRVISNINYTMQQSDIIVNLTV